ncbi:MAG TPA: DEAD/DEAH box helicase family protein [Mucilaginibacter sp.]|jgi:superfamily II DNA or RNA helicase
MLNVNDYEIIYSSGEREPLEFFIDSLMESNSFDLGLGYFSSSGIRALSLGFAYFIYRGGQMRIIINNILSDEDKTAIIAGNSSQPADYIQERFQTDLTKLYETLNKHDIHFFRCLSWMIAEKKIQFKAIVPKDRMLGIAHQKFGIFHDENFNKIAFNGSANFSQNALLNNMETLSCYTSWSGERLENERIQYFTKLFEKCWEGKSAVADIIPLDKIETFIKNSFPVESLNELILEELQLIGEAKSITINQKLKIKLDDIQLKLSNLDRSPKFPSGKSPKPYQLTALENWKSSNYQGFFEMATGTGKTITALNCAVHIFQIEKRVRALILVPSLSLAEQWGQEASEFSFGNVIIANSLNKNWVQEALQEVNKSFVLNNSFIIIATYETFALDKFGSIVNRLNADVLFIADEAHNLGTSRLIARYPHKFRRRIGLSATPQRHFDDEGTAAILEFFNALEKPTFRLDMKEAIEKGYLCEYTYLPYIVTLTADELEEYKEISKQLLKYFNTQTQSYEDNPRVTALKIKRKRIIHKAHNKADCLRKCLQNILDIKGCIQYTLVYVPEGNDPLLDTRLINDYSAIVTNEFNVSQHQFIGETKNRGTILNQFAEGEIQVLTAMKCLDEGVDVARTETAIFCSSTGNPRQFIQRRGRILRRHQEKRVATIYDMIVVPDINSIANQSNLSMEKSILQAELRRVYEFASLSKNKYQALKTLENIADEYGIDIFSTEISQ